MVRRLWRAAAFLILVGGRLNMAGRLRACCALQSAFGV